METLEEEKQVLIELIEWYRDEYHRKDFGHTEMIEKIRKATESEQLEMYWQHTDRRLDND